MLPGPGAAVLDDGQLLGGWAQHPSHAHSSEFRLQCPARAGVRAHRRQRLRAEYRGHGRVAEMTPRVAQLISRRGHQPAGGGAAAWEGPKVDVDNGFTVDHVVRCCDVRADYLFGEVTSVVELQWL